MSNLREEAEAYQPRQTMNVADLTAVPLDDIEVNEREAEDSDGKPFSYKYIIIDGKEYRIPNSVIEEIQKILKLKPEVKAVKVNKSGSGLATRYSVDPVE